MNTEDYDSITAWMADAFARKLEGQDETIVVKTVVGDIDEVDLDLDPYLDTDTMLKMVVG